MNIICPNCQRKYHIDQWKIAPGRSSAKCKACGHTFSLDITPSAEPPPRAGMGKELRSQAQPRDKKFTRPEDLAGQASKATQQPPLPARKTQLVLGAVASIILLVLVGLVVGSNLSGIDWGEWIRAEAAKKASVARKEAPVVGEGTGVTEKRAPVHGVITAPKPFLGVNVNVPLLLEALEKRVPEEKRDLRYQMTITTLKSLNLRRLQLFLYPDLEYTASPVLLLHGSDHQSMANFIGGEGPLKPFVERMADGSYRFTGEAFPGPEKNNFPVDLYRIWLIENGALMAPKSLFNTGSQAKEALIKSRVARFAASIGTDQDLVALALRIPEGIYEGWEKRIRRHPALKGNPQAAMLASMGGSIMSQLTEPFKQIEALAVGFRFSGEKGRVLRYAQQFRKGIDGAKVYGQLNTKNWDDMDVEGIVMTMAKIIRDERYDSTLQFKDNRLVLQFNWSEKDDRAIFAALSEATIGHMFAQAVVEMKPTEGAVETQYVDEPPLVTPVDADKLETMLPERFKESLFPGHFWTFGGDPHMILELDPVDIPNATMAQVDYEVLAINSPDGGSVLRKGGDKDKPPIQPGSPSPGHISLHVQNGIPGEALGKAKIRFDLSLPVKLGIVEFKAGEPEGTVKESEGLAVKLSRLEKDVATVSYYGGKSGRLLAFDKSGRQLARQESMSSASSVSTRFRGVIHTLKVVSAREMRKYSFEVEVELNRGKELKLARKPDSTVRPRYDRRPIVDYAAYTEQDLDNLQVKWDEDGESFWSDSLSITLPKEPFSGHAVWEAHFFGKDKRLILWGNPSLRGRSLRFTVKKGELKKANAGFGRAQLKLRTGIKRLSFVRQGGVDPVEKKLPSGQRVAVSFEKNQITFDVGKAQIVQYMAYDAEGRRLKDDNFTSREGRGAVYFWGQPARFLIDVAANTIEKLIHFDLKQRPVDARAYRAFKQDIEIQREIVKNLRVIGHARDKAHSLKLQCRDDLAGLYYLYNEKNEPMRLIDKAIAHSDPAGQARFGYTVEPFKGYYFTVLSGTKAKGIRKKYGRQPKKKEYTWEKGTFTEFPLGAYPTLAAIPKSKTQPTFFLHRNRVYMKHLNGAKLEYMPINYHDTGWRNARFIGT